MATTLFGMFFGAGNLIFPVHLGQMAGSNVIPAIIGFIITAVGIPIFGVAAIGVTHADGLQALSGKVGRGYGIFFTCLLYLTIGPLFAIPRCATVSFTTGVSPMLSEAAQPLALLLFSAVFFAFVLFFSLRPGKITVWIGKIINPVFLLFLAVLVIAALLNPGASISAVAPTEPYATKTSAFFSSFIEGYGTMDAIAGLAFGIVVIDVIRRIGVDNDDAVAVDVLGSGVLTGILMAVIYVVTILMGTQSRGLFEISDNGGIALTQIAGPLFRRCRPDHSRRHHHLRLSQDLHRPRDLLLGNICQNDTRQNFLQGLGNSVHAVFLCRFQRGSECHHRIFHPRAYAHLPARHRTYHSGVCREVLPARPRRVCFRHDLHMGCCDL